MAVISAAHSAPLRSVGCCPEQQPAVAGACSSHFDRLLLDLAAHPNRFQVHAAAALRLRKLLRHRTGKAKPPAVTLAARNLGILSQPGGEEATDASDGEQTPSTAGLNTTDDDEEEEGEQEEVSIDLDEPGLSPCAAAMACHLVRRPSRSRWSRGITVDAPLPKAASSVEEELASTAGSASQDQDALPPPQTNHSSPQMKTMQREGPTTCWHALDEPFGGQGDVCGLGVEQSPLMLAFFEQLDSGSGRRATVGADTTAAAEHLRLIAGAFGVPHPEKAKNGGADSFFASPSSGSLGIADGVGEWEWRFGINARNFADEIMAGCLDSLESQKHDGVRMKSEARALQAFREGYTWTRSFGSSTASVAVLGPGGGGGGGAASSFAELGVANLGDSALLVLRRQEVAAGSGGLLRCVARTREQQHSFNCPYQLSLLPTEADFPELLRQGKEKLVRGLANKPTIKQDMPEDAELYTFSVQEGDLIIMGTDGVFDNLYVHEICQLVRFAVPPSEAQESQGLGGESGVDELTDPGQIATTIVTAAFHRSMDRAARTPFSDHARQAGFYHTGGKMDDITCVCAWLAARDGAAGGGGGGGGNFFEGGPAAAQE